MTKTLRYLSISHETASVVQRERYFIPDSEKGKVTGHIRKKFLDVTGLFLLVTCNRTEIYFESEATPAAALRDFLIAFKTKADIRTERNLFRKSDKTELTLRHLLKVSSGLSSQVLGDAEIVHQIKKAYQFTMSINMQGSLLERAMQSVFKTHKRISNETEFRDGTTSVAYKSLKVVSTTYKGDHATTKKILLIGSGDIVRQLLKYNTKFNFSNVHISNRTRDKAEWLASQYGCALYDWNKVLENQFADFDVIISAAGNCHHLIKEIGPSKRTRLLIDLALPGNIDASLAKLERVLFYDLDTISSELEDTKDKRISAIGKVNDLIDEELRVYVDWYKEAPLRAFLAAYKIVLSQKVEAFYETQPVAYNEQDIAMVTERVMRKLLKKDLFSLSDNALEAIIKTQVHQDYAMC